MELCSILCASLNGRGIWWENGDTCMYGWSPETTTMLLISYTPIQNKKFKVWKNKSKKKFFYHLMFCSVETNFTFINVYYFTVYLDIEILSYLSHFPILFSLIVLHHSIA